MEQKIYPIHFAPLQGYTDAAYRNAHELVFGNIDTYYTPFVRLEKGDRFRVRELRDVEQENNKVSHLVPQLIGGTPDEFRKIATMFIDKGHTEADINLGCPFPMLARRHKGAGILPYPDEVKSLLAVTQEFPQLKFSVKLRLGWESAEECLALLPMLNDIPLRHITLHARLGKQQYTGETDLEAFDAFYQSCRHPLLFNGDLLTSQNIRDITTRFPNLIGVMIGRGLLMNPALATEYSIGKPFTSEEMLAKLRSFHSMLLDHYREHLQGDAQLLCKMKTLWEYLLPDIDKKIKKRIHKATKIEIYEGAA
ncbi:MAG: tRNA-dihydrouridine synthase family protein, partial [Bacteroides sp.]